MATGAEHYREAEKLLTAVNRRTHINDDLLHSREQRLELQAKAQVHATLALAAATALPAATAGTLPEDDCADWRAAVAAS